MVSDDAPLLKAEQGLHGRGVGTEEVITYWYGYLCYVGEEDFYSDTLYFGYNQFSNKTLYDNIKAILLLQKFLQKPPVYLRLVYKKQL